MFTLLIIGESEGLRLWKKSASTEEPAIMGPIGNGNPLQITPTAILTTPDRGCPAGQRKDNKGRCRTLV